MGAKAPAIRSKKMENQLVDNVDSVDSVDSVKKEKSMKELAVYLVKNDPAFKNVDKVEVKKAVALCHFNNLNPLTKEVYFLPFKGRIQLVISVDVMKKRALQSGLCGAMTTELIKENDVVVGAKATVARWHPDSKSWLTFTETALLVEFKKDDTFNKDKPCVWRDKPTLMIKKVALALCLRLAFTDYISGVYLREELDATPVKQEKNVNIVMKKEEVKDE